MGGQHARGCSLSSIVGRGEELAWIEAIDMMSGVDYVYLLGLAALWGSSYPLIKVALAGHVAPAEIVLVRLIVAVAALYLVVRLRGLSMPRTERAWRAFVAMGLVGTAAPFFLISWGETHIGSSLAAILSATVPFFTVLLAHLWTRDERLTLLSAVGIVIGFLGVVVLVGDVRLDARSAPLLGVAALLGSSLCYGTANIVARKALMGIQPEVASTGQMLLGAIFIAAPGTASGLAVHQAPTPAGLLAVATMGLLGTAGAYLLYYRLIANVGSARTSTVGYLLPAFAVLYGTLLLHEALTVRMLLGFTLILLGVAVVNGRLGQRRSTPATATAGAAR